MMMIPQGSKRVAAFNVLVYCKCADKKDRAFVAELSINTAIP